VELAGTGLRVKVPVEEPLAQTEVFAMRGKAPGGTSDVKNNPQPLRIEKRLTAEELAAREQQKSTGKAVASTSLWKSPQESLMAARNFHLSLETKSILCSFVRCFLAFSKLDWCQ
jgi:hypothetical protein